MRIRATGRSAVAAVICILTICGESKGAAPERQALAPPPAPPASQPASLTPFTADHTIDFAPSDWLLWPETGKLWVTDRAKARLVEVDPADGRQLRTVPIGQDVIAVVAAGKMLAVASDKGQSLMVVDPTAAKVVKTIPLSGPPEHLAASAVGDRVYVNGPGPLSPNSHQPIPTVWEVDLKDGACRPLTDKYRQSADDRTEVSADGRILAEYNSHGGGVISFAAAGDFKTNRTGMFFEVVPPSVRDPRPGPTFGPRAVNRIIAQPVPDPRGHFWFLGGKIVSRGLDRVLADIGPGRLAVPDPQSSLLFMISPRPSAGAINRVALLVCNLNGFREIKSVLVVGLGDDQTTHLMVDGPRQRVILASGQKWATISYQKLGVRPQPLLALAHYPPQSVLTGGKTRWPIEWADPKWGAGATFKLAGDCEGITVDGQSLVFDMPAARAGNHDYVLQVVIGETRYAFPFSVTASDDRLLLDHRTPADVGKWGYCEETGTLWATNFPGTRVVELVPETGQQRGVIEVEGKVNEGISEIVSLGKWVVLAATYAGQIRVVDTSALGIPGKDPIATVVLPGQIDHVIVPAKGNYLYCPVWGDSNDQATDDNNRPLPMVGLYQVDLAKGAIRWKVHGENPLRSKISADGRVVAGEAGVWELDPEKKTAQKVVSESDMAVGIPDPRGTFWLHSNEIKDRLNSKTTATFKPDMAGRYVMDPGSDLALGWWFAEHDPEGAALTFHVFSVNKLANVRSGRVFLAPDFTYRLGAYSSLTADLFVDARRERVLMTYGRYWNITPIHALAGSPPPLVHIAGEPEITVPAQRETLWAVQGAGLDKASVKLNTKVSWVTMKDDRMVSINPPADATGGAEFTVTVTAPDGTQSEKTVKLRVLPMFWPMSVESFAYVPKPGLIVGYPLDAHLKGERLIRLDPASGKSDELPLSLGPVEQLAAGDDLVYVAAKGVVSVIDPKAGTVVKSVKFLDDAQGHRVTHLIVLPSKTDLLAWIGNTAQKCYLIDANKGAAQPVRTTGRLSAGQVRPVGRDGLLLGGGMYRLDGLTLTPVQSDGWGCADAAAGVVYSLGNNVTFLDDTKSVVATVKRLDLLRCTAAVDPESRVAIVVNKDGKGDIMDVTESQSLCKFKFDVDTRTIMLPQIVLDLPRKRAFVLLGQRVYAVDYSKFKGQPLLAQIGRITPGLEKDHMVALGQQLKVTLKTEGMGQGVRFSIAEPFGGAAINEQTGELTFTPPPTMRAGRLSIRVRADDSAGRVAAMAVQVVVGGSGQKPTSPR